MDDPERTLIDIMLQEQSQYREEVRMFDSHGFRTLLTYFTGIIAIFGWLVSRLLDRSSEVVKEALAMNPPKILTLSKVVAQVSHDLLQGPFFYLFTGVPIITGMTFLVLARDWASLNERFDHLKNVGERISSLFAKPPCHNGPIIFTLDQGYSPPGRGRRGVVEGVLFGFCLFVAVSFSIIILLSAGEYIDSLARTLWFWGASLGGLVLGLVFLIVAWNPVRNRPYSGRIG